MEIVRYSNRGNNFFSYRQPVECADVIIESASDNIGL